jgi:hypothetical protein
MSSWLDEKGALLSALALVALTAAPAASESNLLSPMRGAPETQPPAAATPPPSTPHSSTPWVRGRVLETMDAAGYTYVHIDTGSGKKWAAGPETAVDVGDEVAFPSGAMEMKNFESKSLGRRFESIAFVETLVVGDSPAAGNAAAKNPHAGLPGMGSSGDPHAEVKSIARVEGGYTVGEIYDKRRELEGTEVSVRGKVVKYTARVMGKNWIHLRDGSTGEAGANDLTVTTGDQAAVGDMVVARGRVGVSRDFGFGYRYDVILESATIRNEK